MLASSSSWCHGCAVPVIALAAATVSSGHGFLLLLYVIFKLLLLLSSLSFCCGCHHCQRCRCWCRGASWLSHPWVTPRSITWVPRAEWINYTLGAPGSQVARGTSQTKAERGWAVRDRCLVYVWREGGGRRPARGPDALTPISLSGLGTIATPRRAQTVGWKCVVI